MIGSLVLGIFLLGTFLGNGIQQVHAQPSQSVNTIVNPGFENSPLLTGWATDINDDGTYGDTITASSTLAHTGTYSARIDISNNSTSIKLGTKVTNSHIELIQYLPPNTMMSNLTDRPSGLNFWFYIQPKFAGYSFFEARIRAGSTAEMDYIYLNPGIVSQFQFANSTTGSEGGKPLKQIMLTTPPFNQWNHLTRNVRQDWLAPLKLPNGTLVSDFNITDTFSRFEADANFFMDATNNVYAETAWVDDVAIYLGNVIPLPSFTYQDWTGSSVDSLITQKILNMSGAPVQLSPGTLIASDTYTLTAYYHGTRIFSDPITPETPQPVQLAMTPIDTSRSGFIATNNTVRGIAVTQNTESQIAFAANGTGASLIIADVTTQPIAIVQNGASISTWSYNGTANLLFIQTSWLGAFSISFRPVMPMPQLTFEDLTGATLGNAINPRIVNSQGIQEQPLPNSLVPIGAYTLAVYYEGHSLYSSTITPSLSSTIHLNMFPLGSNSSYIAFNSTVSGVSISENSLTRIRFISTGTGPTLVVVKVPAKPVSVEENGASLSSWTYNSTSGTVAIQSASLGTFTIDFASTSNSNLLLIVGGVIAAVGAVASAMIIMTRRGPRPGKAALPSNAYPLKKISDSDKYRKRKN